MLIFKKRSAVCLQDGHGPCALLQLPELETSDTEDTTDDEDDYKSIRSRQRSNRKRKIRPTGLPEDTGYTMGQFLQDLNPEMTSTQQSQFETQTTNRDTTVQESQTMDSFSSAYDAQSRSSSRKKKKKKTVAGF